jgi:hypothetical protein
MAPPQHHAAAHFTGRALQGILNMYIVRFAGLFEWYTFLNIFQRKITYSLVTGKLLHCRLTSAEVNAFSDMTFAQYKLSIKFTDKAGQII